jgi:hypothetical protein
MVHDIVPGQGRAQLVDVARIAPEHGHPIAERLELLRGPHERGHGVASLARLLDERTTGATRRAQDEEPGPGPLEIHSLQQ